MKYKILIVVGSNYYEDLSKRFNIRMLKKKLGDQEKQIVVLQIRIEVSGVF